MFFSHDKALSNEKNFEDKLNKVKNILNVWKQRDLTIIGRIQIVKTFIISQFTYVTAAVHMDKCYIDRLNQLMWNFVWKGKREKMKRNILTQSIKNGGLKAPDVVCILKAAMVKWVHRYVFGDDHPWKKSFEWFLKKYNIDTNLILKSNFEMHRQDQQDLPAFYRDALNVWSEVGNTIAGKETLLWYNKNIQIDGKSVYYKSFVNAGMQCVHDLYNDDGRIVPFEAWRERGLETSDFLKWCGLVKASKALRIGGHSKHECNQQLTVQTNVTSVALDKVKMKAIYLGLVERKREIGVTIPRVAKWLPDNVVTDWGQIYKQVHVNSVDVKTREFQYKFLNDILSTNYWLHKYKLRENNMCTFCRLETENIEHLFYTCIHVRRLWNQVQLWYNDIESGTMLDKTTIFLGAENSLLHTVVMTAKRYIFACKCIEMLPTFCGFRNRLCEIRKFELYGTEHISNVKALMKWAPTNELI